jgi:hypothetical protein
VSDVCCCSSVSDRGCGAYRSCCVSSRRCHVHVCAHECVLFSLYPSSARRGYCVACSRHDLMHRTDIQNAPAAVFAVDILIQ